MVTEEIAKTDAYATRVEATVAEALTEGVVLDLSLIHI